MDHYGYTYIPLSLLVIIISSSMMFIISIHYFVSYMLYIYMFIMRYIYIYIYIIRMCTLENVCLYIICSLLLSSLSSLYSYKHT